MSIKNVRLDLSYEGTRYHGWQRQKGGPTIQGVVEEKLQTMVHEPVTVIASGRTDAGVHALRQVCNFTTTAKIPPEGLKKGLNSLLPKDIRVREVRDMPLDFHARYHAKSKTYEYRILNRKEPDLFQRRIVWHVRPSLDIKEIKKCLALVEGTHDFSSFCSSGGAHTTPVRRIIRAELYGPQDSLISLVFEADGFLRHMVRNIVGTLVAVGLGKIDSIGFQKIFESRDRTAAGMKAPAQGLFLTDVGY